MKDVNQNENSSMSVSQMRRLSRKKEVERMKRNARLTKVFSYCLITLLCVSLVLVIGYSVYKNIIKVKPSSDYSAYLTENGSITEGNATDYLELVDYSDITIPLSDIEYTDEDMDKEIETVLKEHLNTETDALVEDGSNINIDYVGTIDDVEFEGGNTNGGGSDLIIGSNSLIDDFEDQLIGHGVGDEVTVDVTFPTDYSKNTDVAGKDAVFKVVINGIYPELNDEFVQENFSEYAATAEEYKEYLKTSNYEDNLSTWLDTYLIENTTVKSYPKNYTKHLQSIKKYEDQNNYEYLNQLYASMGYDAMESFEDYIDMSEEKYDAGLEEVAQNQAKRILIYQSIFEKEKLTIAEDEYTTYFEDSTTEDYTSRVEQYGKGYVMQYLMQEKVSKLLKELVTVE